MVVLSRQINTQGWLHQLYIFIYHVPPHYYFISPNGISQHGLQVLCDLERRLGLGLDLVNSHSICDLNEGEALGEVDIEDTLFNQ